MFGDGGRQPWTRAALETRRSCQQLCSNVKEEHIQELNEQDPHAQCPCLSHNSLHWSASMLKIPYLPKIKVYIHNIQFQSTGGALHKQRGTSAVVICRNAFVMLLSNFWWARLCNTVYKSMSIRWAKVDSSHVGAFFVRDAWLVWQELSIALHSFFFS